MTPEKIRERLLSLREMDFAGSEKLADEITKEARVPLWELCRVVRWPESPNWPKAESILKQLNELSILPWLAASQDLQGGPRLKAVVEASRVYDEFNKQIIETLRSMLSGKTTLPPPAVPGTVETPYPVVRECDEAFLQLRHLHLPDEPESSYRMYGSRFVRMTNGERDRYIRQYLDTGKFND